MSNKKSGNILSGKGYYIALVLCAVAIGIAGILYYQNAAGKDAPTMQEPKTTAPVSAANKDEVEKKEDVQTVAPQPGQQSQDTPVQQPVVQPSQKPSVVKQPLAGETILPYAMDTLTYNPTTRDWRVHNGVDIAAEAGTQVCAAAAGTVYSVYEDEAMGVTVVIQHEGNYATQYASLSQEVSVKAGDTVKAGQVIGTVGNTALMENAIGDHLHFAVSCAGELVDPADFLR